MACRRSGFRNSVPSLRRDSKTLCCPILRNQRIVFVVELLVIAFNCFWIRMLKVIRKNEIIPYAWGVHGRDIRALA